MICRLRSRASMLRKKCHRQSWQNRTWKADRVLLAEDNEINTFVARRILESKGILVEHAENGKRAVELVEQNPEGYFDAIVMDIRMPVMSGLEAARQIRAMSRTDAQTVPIIAMTGQRL